MLTARPAAAPALYNGGEFDPEFARVLRIGNPGAALRRALTFSPGSDLTPAVWFQRWESWQEGIFASRLAPGLLLVANHAGQGSVREIQALDQELAASLDSESVERSTLAGKRLLRRLSGARGERLLTKLQVQSDAGSLPTHFLTIYAVQSALFHLSLRLLLPGFAYWEWTAAMQACPPLGQPALDFAQATPRLQGIVQITFSSHAFHAVQPFAAAVGAS